MEGRLIYFSVVLVVEKHLSRQNRFSICYQKSTILQVYMNFSVRL
jgi:hypothetical protein